MTQNTMTDYQRRCLDRASRLPDIGTNEFFKEDFPDINTQHTEIEGKNISGSTSRQYINRPKLSIFTDYNEDLLKFLFDREKRETTLIIYIGAIIEPYRETVTLTREAVRAATGLSLRYITLATQALVEEGLLSPHEQQSVYYINPKRFFKGDLKLYRDRFYPSIQLPNIKY